MNIKATDKNLPKQVIKNELLQLKTEFEQELINLLAFWATKTVDLENGGFIGEMDHYGNVVSKASKGGILNSRILWTFSAAYRTTGNIKYKELANRTYQYIIKHFWDIENGGLIWEIDYLGNPLNSRKQAYAQSFGIYAFSEYYRATNKIESLNYAKELYSILENNFWDAEYGGYGEALTRDWNEIDNMRLSDKDMNAPKSMNTHLHILESYTNLFRAWSNGKLKESINSLIDIFKNEIVNSKSNHLNLFFEMDWKVISTEVSFGHNIEAAWLLNEADLMINNHKLTEEVKEITSKLMMSTLAEGLDKDGSLFNNRCGNKYDTDKHWWPQAEAMVALLDAYEINPNQAYITHLDKIWNFIKYNIIDKDNGEWYWRVDENSLPNTSEVKVGFWKCPYHNGRALMELIERIEKIK